MTMGLLDLLMGRIAHPEALRFFLEIAVKSILILGAAWLSASVLRRLSAAARHLIFTIALAGVLALPFAAALLPAWRVSLLPLLSPLAMPDESSATYPVFQASQSGTAAMTHETGDAPEMVAHPPGIGRSDSSRSASENTTASLSTGPALADRRSDLSAGGPEESKKTSAVTGWLGVRSALLIIWLAGALMTMLRLLAGMASVWWIARRSREITDPGWLSLLRNVGEQLGLSVKARLLRGRRATMPMAWGIWRPVLLMPAHADDWSLERRRVVMLHELAHVKRRDCLTQMLAELACAFYWFNPLAWMAAARLTKSTCRPCWSNGRSELCSTAAFRGKSPVISRAIFRTALTAASEETFRAVSSEPFPSLSAKRLWSGAA